MHSSYGFDFVKCVTISSGQFATVDWPFGIYAIPLVGTLNKMECLQNDSVYRKWKRGKKWHLVAPSPRNSPRNVNEQKIYLLFYFVQFIIIIESRNAARGDNI